MLLYVDRLNRRVGRIVNDNYGAESNRKKDRSKNNLFSSGSVVSNSSVSSLLKSFETVQCSLHLMFNGIILLRHYWNILFSIVDVEQVVVEILFF